MLSQWQKPLQCFIAILSTLLVGTLIANISNFSHTQVIKHLSLSELIIFLTQIAALVLLYLLAREIKEALPNNGKTSSFIRGILPATAALLILILGQDVIMDILAPYLSSKGERIVIFLFWLAILVSGTWFIWSSYIHGPQLVAGILALAHHFEQWGKQVTLCPACGAHVKDDMTFCSYCGAQLPKGSISNSTKSSGQPAIERRFDKPE